MAYKRYGRSSYSSYRRKPSYSYSRYTRKYPRKNMPKKFPRQPFPTGVTIVGSTEVKYHDWDIDAAIPKYDVGEVDSNLAPANSIRHNCNIIAQGVSASSRIGRKITIKRIEFDAVYHLAAKDGDFIRCNVILDRQCNGGNTGEVPKTVFTGAHPVSHPKLENNKRFQILLQKTLVILNQPDHVTLGELGVMQAVESGVARKHMKFSIDCNIEIDYSGSDAEIASVRSNNIFVLLQSLEGKTTVAARGRTLFTDV